MRSEVSSDIYLPGTVNQSVKLLVVGSLGVGKTTLVGSVSEIRPLRTEETMTRASDGIDDLRGVQAKTTTTVAMDFGRITLSTELVLYVFGAPGQRRFWRLWAGLSEGAVGVLLLVDTRRLADSFEVLDQIEEGMSTLPLVVAVNQFPDSPPHPLDRVRAALDLAPGTPVVDCDARDRRSSITTLMAVVEHALTAASPTASSPAPFRT